MFEWTEKYRKFLNLPQIGKELNTPVKKEDLKSLLVKMANDLPDHDVELSEELLNLSVTPFYWPQIFKFLKDYYILITAVPIVFGGFMQFNGLMSVGKPYLRFFSASQLLTDGLIILFFIVTFLCILLLFTVIIWLFKVKKQVSLFVSVFIFFSCVLVIIDEWNSILQLDFNSNNSTALLGLGALIFVNLGIWTDTKVTKYLVFLFYALSMLFYIGVLMIILKIGITSFKETYSIDDIGNKKVLTCVLKKDNLDFNTYEVLYYNDKYIFVKLHWNGTEEIRVLPFDTLFKGDACLH